VNRTPNQSFFIEFPKEQWISHIRNACMVRMRDKSIGWEACYWGKAEWGKGWALIGAYPTWEEAAHAAQIAFDLGLPEPR
jgi:hypothetical protein